MKTLLITGGTDGIGRALAIHYLKDGYHVIAVGSSPAKGEKLISDTASMMEGGSLQFLQANLSLPSENQRVIEHVKNTWDHLDGLILCAASLKPQESYRETAEGYEFTFSLYYLSRFILSYGLKSLLEKSSSPFIVNVAAPGMKGEVNWDDIQFKNSYDGSKVQFHGSRLNDLLGVQFAASDPESHIRYILFNPMAAKTSGASKMASGIYGMFMKLYYKLMGKTPEEIADIISQHVSFAHAAGLEAYLLRKPVDLSKPTFDPANAKRLDQMTRTLLSDKVIL